MQEAVFKYEPKPQPRESIMYLGAARKALVNKYREIFISCGYTSLEAQFAAEWYSPGPWVTDAEIAEAENE